MGGEDGQGTLEYLAVVLLVAGVSAAAAALLVATGLGERIVGAFKRGLCVVAGQACEPPRTPCVRRAERHTEGGVLDVLFLRIGERSTEMRERFADGTVAYTTSDAGDAGFVARAGAEVHVRWGDRTWAYGEELKFAVLAGQTSGRTWVRSGDAQAQDVSDRVELERFDVPVPKPDITFSERRGSATASLDLGDVVALDLGGRRAYGERFDHRTGERTVYVTSAGGGAATVMLPQSSSARGALRGEERYAVTFGRDGEPKDLTVLGAVDVEGSVELPGHLASLAGRLGVPLRGARHVEIEQHLDLTVPANAEIARAFLGKDPGGGDVALTAAVLRDRLRQEGTATVRAYRTTANAHEAGAHVMGIGGEVGTEDESAELDRALARGADGRWVDDPMCAT
jgi:hypothetical protein